MTDWKDVFDHVESSSGVREEIVDKIVADGLVNEPEIVGPLLSEKLRGGGSELAYEVCHALLDFEVLDVSSELQEALEPFIYHSSRRVCLAALQFFLKTRGVQFWEQIRDHLPLDRVRIGQSLMDRIIQGRA